VQNHPPRVLLSFIDFSQSIRKASARILHFCNPLVRHFSKSAGPFMASSLVELKIPHFGSSVYSRTWGVDFDSVVSITFSIFGMDQSIMT
jgi:hypothetical protein